MVVLFDDKVPFLFATWLGALSYVSRVIDVEETGPQTGQVL